MFGWLLRLYLAQLVSAGGLGHSVGFGILSHFCFLEYVTASLLAWIDFSWA